MSWRLVPTEPTEEMEEAVEHIADDRDYHEDIYCCMLDASPPASQDEALVVKVAFVLCEYDEENPGTCGCGGRCTNTHAIGQARAVLKMLEGNQ